MFAFFRPASLTVSPTVNFMTKTMLGTNIHRIHNGAQTTKSRPGRLLLLSFEGWRLSKAAPGMSFSVRTTAVEFGLEVAFAILQFCIKAIRTLVVVSLDLMSSVRHYEDGV